MLKSTFVVFLVSLAFIGIIKENSAGFTENNAQTQSPSENSPVRTENEDQPQSSFEKEPGRTENDNHKQNPSEEKYEPFMVVALHAGIEPNNLAEIFPLSAIYQLPSKLVKIEEKWSLAAESNYTFEIPSCPEIKPQNNRAEIIRSTLQDIFSGYYNCLFLRNFQDNRKEMCDEEPRSTLVSRIHNDGSPVICGVKDYQQLVDVQYYNCGTENYLKQFAARVEDALTQNHLILPAFKPVIYRIYEVCYDFQYKKTLWTRHTPMTPQLLVHPESPYKNLSNEILLNNFRKDCSTLDLHYSTFFTLKKPYESTDPTTSTIYTLVPKQHMALLYWKKATDHMINSAPLSPEFIPLMEAINNGILKASYNLLVKSQRTLQIYTKAETNILTMLNFATHTSLPFIKSAVSYIRSDAPVNLFKPNTWFKFVYDESEKSGVLIVLHNTLEKLPDRKECNIEDRLFCDFKNWSNSAETFPDEVLTYAYCCKVSQERVKSLFSIKELQLQKAFDIQETIDQVPTEPVESDAGEDKGEKENKSDNEGKSDIEDKSGD